MGVEDANAEIPTIAFVHTIAAESIGSLPPLTTSCRIQGRSDEDRVTLTHTSSGALLFVDGDGSEVIELLFLNFEGATQVTTTTVGVPAMAEFLVTTVACPLEMEPNNSSEEILPTGPTKGSQQRAHSRVPLGLRLTKHHTVAI